MTLTAIQPCTRSYNMAQKLFPIRFFSLKQKIQLKSGRKLDIYSSVLWLAVMK